MTVEDDDTVGITVAPTTLTIPEGEARTYEVRLGSRPSARRAGVSCRSRATRADGTEFICCGSSNVPFTPESWDHPRTFTVTAPQDEDADDGTLWVAHFSLSDDPDYNRIPIATVTAYAVDDDAGAPLTLGTPPDLALTAGRAIAGTTLPPAGGGTGRYTYSLEGAGGAALPTWLSFNPNTRRLSGTPPTAAAAVTLDYTVNDGETSVPRSFTVTVNAALDLTAPGNQTYTAGTAIPALTLAAASGGTAPLGYTLTGLPGGLSFNGTSRRLFGTPQTAGAYTVTYRVTDANGASDSDTFTITVNAATVVDTTAPTVLSIERHDGTNAQDENTNANSVTFRVTFSEAVENVNAADFGASGTTAGASAAAAVTGNAAQYIVTVSGGDMATYEGVVGLTFANTQNIQDLADNANALDATLPTGTNYQTYTLDKTAPAPTLLASPDIHDGSSDLTIVVDFGEEVTGFVIGDLGVTGGTTSNLRRITTVQGDPVYNVTLTPTVNTAITVTLAANVATDRAGNASLAATDVTVPYVEALDLLKPDDLEFTVGRPVSVTFQAATGGVDPLTYDLVDVRTFATVALPGLTFDVDTLTLSGTPTTATPGAIVLSFQVFDDASTTNVVLREFNLTINAAPALAAVAAQDWPVNTAVDFDLPAATGGTTPLTYELEGPSGAALPTWMDFDGTADPPNISGTPPAAAAAVTYTYKVTDANDAEAEVEFAITLSSTDTTAPTVMSVERHDGTSEQDERTNADSVTFRVTFSEARGARRHGGLRRQRDDRRCDRGGRRHRQPPPQYIVTVSGGSLAHPQRRGGPDLRLDARTSRTRPDNDLDRHPADRHELRDLHPRQHRARR